MTTKFDPTDVAYQVDDKYKPDKESTWHFPAEKDGWVVAHDSLRNEMTMIREAFEAIKERNQPLNAWEIKAITTVVLGHVEHVHCHHTNEDDIFVPEIKKRFNYPKKVRQLGGRFMW
jgi:Hemerythrin HHE cation binding domain